ncbi:MAG: hypothetical protein ACI9FG_001676 [Crocinitomicaceae bacterium]|jgi:hypothetical protein
MGVVYPLRRMADQRKTLVGSLSIALIALIAVLGYFLMTAFQGLESTSRDTEHKQSSPRDSVQKNSSANRASKVSPTAPVEEASDNLDAETPKEGLVRFSSEEQYRAFLNSLSSRGLRLLGSSDKLRTVRVGFTNFGQLEDIDGSDISPNFPVYIPSPPDVGAQVGAQAFGANALEAIGIFEDNSTWGKGVTVAVIDSGVNQHIALEDGIKRLTLTELADDATQLGHGTAVASIISGNHPLTQGVAPAADILSVRITDDQGSSNSFTLAEGIIAAVDGGAQIINISMGSEGNSIVVADAVAYAQRLGAVLVASSGNEGASSPAYPAAYDGVISVGAVEAGGEHLNFSNTGENLSIVAPGYEVNAAWGENQMTAFTGTSASAPFVSGAIAAVMSENPGYTAQQAANLVIRLSNEAGQAGSDPQYGQGSLDVGRALENGQSGIYDIAVTSQILGSNSAGSPQITILVQNQGTETLFNSPVRIQTPSGTTNISINSLTPGQVHATSLPLSSLTSGETAIIYSSASTSGSEDNQLGNNSRQNSYSQSAE